MDSTNNREPLRIILMSGSPGTGKTTIAQYLEEHHGWQRCSLGEIVIREKLIESDDSERDAKVIDEEKFQAFIIQYLNNMHGTILVEGHYADLVDHPAIHIGFVLRCHPHILHQRLEARKYKFPKIRENIQAEILGHCTGYMLEKEQFLHGKNLFEIDTSHLDIPTTAELIFQIVSQPEKSKKYKAGKLSWMSDPSVEITRYLD